MEVKRIFSFRADPAGFMVDPIIALIVGHDSELSPSIFLLLIVPRNSGINSHFEL